MIKQNEYRIIKSTCRCYRPIWFQVNFDLTQVDSQFPLLALIHDELGLGADKENGEST